MNQQVAMCLKSCSCSPAGDVTGSPGRKPKAAPSWEGAAGATDKKSENRGASIHMTEATGEKAPGVEGVPEPTNGSHGRERVSFETLLSPKNGDSNAMTATMSKNPLPLCPLPPRGLRISVYKGEHGSRRNCQTLLPPAAGCGLSTRTTAMEGSRKPPSTELEASRL